MSGSVELPRSAEGGAFAAAAGLFATLLASLALSPLLTGWAWLVAVTVVVSVIVGVGAGLRAVQPLWPVALLGQVVAGAVTIVALFARDSAWFGLLPGPGAVDALRSLLQVGLETTRDEAPPVSTNRGVVLLVAGGLAVVGLAVDVVAASLRRPAVAGLPLLAVYCVPTAVLPGGLAWWHFAAGAVGFLVLVGADSAERVHGWGRVLGRAGDEGGSLGGPLAGGRRVAAASVVVAALLPALLPGAGDRLLPSQGNGPGSGRGGSITVINPILSIQQDLTARSDTVVLRYRTGLPEPTPIRIVSDDVFDGDHWSPSVGSIPRDNRVQDGLPPAPGLSQGLFSTNFQTEVRILGLEQTYLPLPYPPTQVNVAGPWLYDARTLNVVGDNVNTRNVSYTAQHLDVAPSAEQLRSAGTPPTSVLDSYGRLPATTPAAIGATARRIAGSGSAYDKAMRLQQWFRSTGGFRYSETVIRPQGKGDGSNDAVLAFLRNKQGYCVQFASAMAVMARTLGIPSRVAVGFLPGTQAADGWWDVSVRDAHAWPELYFSGLGWIRFEPTPSGRAGAPPAWAAPASPASATPTVTATVTPTVTATQETTQAVPVPADAKPSGPSLPSRILAAIPWRVLLALLFVVLLAFVPLGLATLVRRSRWRRAASAAPAPRVEAAWEDLRERLADLGVRWAASWTPRALQVRLADDHRLDGGERAALGRLVDDVEQTRYARPGTGSAREAADLRADVETVLTGVAGSSAVPDWVRRRARWMPSAGVLAIGRRLGLVTEGQPLADGRGRTRTRTPSAAPAAPGSSGDWAGTPSSSDTVVGGPPA